MSLANVLTNLTKVFTACIEPHYEIKSAAVMNFSSGPQLKATFCFQIVIWFSAFFLDSNTNPEQHSIIIIEKLRIDAFH